jgi:hypothetical protein
MEHYPIFSQYNLEGSVTSVPNISATQLGIITFPNPFNEELNIKATKTLTEVQLKLMNVEGQILNAQHYDTIASGSTIRPVLPTLAKGIYFLSVETKQYKTVVKLVHL